jgi:hypothetical protein
LSNGVNRSGYSRDVSLALASHFQRFQVFDIVQRRQIMKLACKEFTQRYPNAPERGVSQKIISNILLYVIVFMSVFCQKKVIARALSLIRQRKAVEKRSPRKYLQRTSTPCSSMLTVCPNFQGNTVIPIDEVEKRIDVSMQKILKTEMPFWISIYLLCGFISGRTRKVSTERLQHENFAKELQGENKNSIQQLAIFSF